MIVHRGISVVDVIVLKPSISKYAWESYPVGFEALNDISVEVIMMFSIMH